PAVRNLISGNNSTLPDAAEGGSQPDDRGIDAENNLGSPGDLIQGNYFGTDKTGMVALPNGNGVFASNNNTIGGTQPGAGNVISGNVVFGLAVNDNNQVAGNLIGTTATGMAALGKCAGMRMTDNNTVCGTQVW